MTRRRAGWPDVSAVRVWEGIDIASHEPKILTTDAVKASDVVITMGCGDTCPTIRANVTKNGNSTIPQVKTSTMSDPSATKSNAGSTDQRATADWVNLIWLIAPPDASNPRDNLP